MPAIRGLAVGPEPDGITQAISQTSPLATIDRLRDLAKTVFSASSAIGVAITLIGASGTPAIQGGLGFASLVAFGTAIVGASVVLLPFDSPKSAFDRFAFKRRLTFQVRLYRRATQLAVLALAFAVILAVASTRKASGSADNQFVRVDRNNSSVVVTYLFKISKECRGSSMGASLWSVIPSSQNLQGKPLRFKREISFSSSSSQPISGELKIGLLSRYVQLRSCLGTTTQVGV
jgi:hypothetical protein